MDYCHLPRYIFCGQVLLCAKLRSSKIDASAGAVDELDRIVKQIRAAWPYPRILVRRHGAAAANPRAERLGTHRWPRPGQGRGGGPRHQR